MSALADRLRAQRNKAWEAAKDLAERAAEENRALSGEEQANWDAANAEMDALDKRIQAVLDAEKRAAQQDEAYEALEGRARTGGGDDTSGRDGTEAARIRAWLRGEGPRALDIRPSGRVFRGDVAEARDLVKGTATAGGNTVPTSFYDRLVAHLIESSAVMQMGVTVLNTAGGETIQIPKTTAHSSASIVTEGNAISESDPAFGQGSLGAFKYGVLIQVSRELLDDTGVDLEGYMAMQAGRALGNALGAHLVTGTGTGQPRGVVTDATVGVTGPVGTATSFGSQSTAGQGGDLLIDLFHSVIGPYRSSSAAGWLLRDGTAAVVRKLKNSQGDYIWQPGLVAGAPDMILGKPVRTDPNVAAPAAGAKSVVFGDWSQYFVRLAGGLRFERSDDYAFNTDLVTFRALLRADAALVDLTGALKVFVHSAT